jgi:hypothetical protein
MGNERKTTPGAGRPQAARVRRTGMALVHEGELVLPADGSAAAAEIVANDDRTVINYYFAVEVEVRGGPESAAESRDRTTRALAAFAQSIDNRA